MNFIFTLITSFFNNIVDKFNNIIENHERKIKLKKLAIIKASYSITFLITFLLGNATSMIAIIYKDALGTLGLFFPISSCVLLYSISIISLKNIIFYSNECKYYKRELKETLSKDKLD